MVAVLRASVWAYLVLLKVYITGWFMTWCHRICLRLGIDSKSTKTEVEESILFSQCWEDPAVLRKALNVSEKDCVLGVASAGDSLLSLLLDNPKRVVGIDSSFPQIALCHLKVAAIKALTYDEFHYFLGFSEAVPDGRKRLEIFRCSLRCQLSATVREFWDSREYLLSGGVVHCGQFEQFTRTFCKLLLPLAHPPRTLHTVLSMRTLRDQQHWVRAHWGSLQWRALHRLYYSEAMMRPGLGKQPRIRNMLDSADSSVGGQLLTRAMASLRDVPIASNYFMEYLLTGNIRGNNSLPDYVQKANFSVLKIRVDRLELVHGDLLAYLQSNHIKKWGTYDALHLSHLPDWVPNIKEVFQALLSHLKPGARVVHWKFLVDRKTETLFPKELRYENKLSNKLKNDDRVFLYKDFVIQTCKLR